MQEREELQREREQQREAGRRRRGQEQQRGWSSACRRRRRHGMRGRRGPLPRCGRLQARRRTERLPTISPLAIDLRAPLLLPFPPFAARLDTRALRRSCARTPKSGQLVPAQRPTDACCARGPDRSVDNYILSICHRRAQEARWRAQPGAAKYRETAHSRSAATRRSTGLPLRRPGNWISSTGGGGAVPPLRGDALRLKIIQLRLAMIAEFSCRNRFFCARTSHFSWSVLASATRSANPLVKRADFDRPASGTERVGGLGERKRLSGRSTEQGDRRARGQQARAHLGTDSHPEGQYRIPLHRGPAPCMLLRRARARWQKGSTRTDELLVKGVRELVRASTLKRLLRSPFSGSPGYTSKCTVVQ